MATRITDNEIGKIFEIWSQTPLGKMIQESGHFQSSTQWWSFLNANPNAYLSEFGLFEIKPQGKEFAKVELLPFTYGEFLYNSLLNDAVRTAWDKGYKEVLGTVKRVELMLFTRPEEVKETVPEVKLGLKEGEKHVRLQPDQGVAKSNNGKPATNKRKRKSKSAVYVHGKEAVSKSICSATT